ncbi:MAG TPA: SDR family oxidoreductase [Methylotenera sp.]|nr:SDR family oxidoreductase [Methylotenera sp.]
MLKVLIVGCGDLGGAVASQLAKSGIEVVGVRRSAQAIDGVHVITADVTRPASLSMLKQIQPDILVYCVAANGQTDEQYKAQYVDGLRNVLATQSENPKLKHAFFVSSTRVYGQKTEELLDESMAAIPADFGGERLLEAENLLNAFPCNSTVLRLSGIYGPGRLRMINLAKSPENWPTQNSWTNRIHRDDAAAFIVYLVQSVLAAKPVQACYIVTDSRPARQHEVLSWIATQFHISTSAEAPIEGGKRLSNQAMLSTGFKLQYPDYQAGYGALIKDAASSKPSPEQGG